MSDPSADFARTSIPPSTERAPSVPLRRANGHSNGETDPISEPLWALASASGELAPLAAKCDRDTHSRVVCCKTLKGEDERTLVDPDIVRDMCVVVLVRTLSL